MSGPGPDRLIVALDVPTVREAEALVTRLDGVVSWFKVGLELFTAAGPEAVRALVRRGVQVMLDLKLHDIPETVERAVRVAGDLGCALCTVHSSGGRRMLERAARAAEGRTRLLAVTVLTSLDERDLAETSVTAGIESVVVQRAMLAMECGIDGVVASPREAARVRAGAPEGFLIVTPGVRPAAADADDQKRTDTPAGARAAGADMVVVGRPIRDADDPRAAAEAITRELA